MKLQGEWTINQEGDEQNSKIVAKWKLILPPEQAAKRDKAVMDHLRNMSDHFGSPFSVDPAGLCSMWESAWMAGRDSAHAEQREVEKAKEAKAAELAAKRKRK